MLYNQQRLPTVGALLYAGLAYIDFCEIFAGR